MVDKKFDFLNYVRNLKCPTSGQLIVIAFGLVAALALFIFSSSRMPCNT
jgi:hypothetical protein